MCVQVTAEERRANAETLEDLAPGEKGIILQVGNERGPVKRRLVDMGLQVQKPEGAFYIMMNIREILGKKIGGVTIDTCDTFAAELLSKGLVAVVPGSGFDAPEFVRWSYATPMENIQEGMDRLERFLKDLEV